MKSHTQLEKQHFDEAKSWDEDRVVRLAKSEKRAWIVAMGAGVMALASVLAVAGLAPLKTVEPFVVKVDKSTGLVDVVSGITEGEDRDYEDVIDEHFINTYMRHREGYLPETRDYDRHVVGLMSDTGVSQQYIEYTDPRKHKKAPISVYGDTAEVRIKIKNISPIGNDLSQVRYKKTVSRSGQKSPATHWVATIAYRYSNARMKTEDRRISPLGFQVTQYRNDPETLGGNN